MNKEDQMREVREVVAEMQARGDGQKPWMVKELCDRHDDIEGPDRDWHRICAYDAMDAAVREVVGAGKQKRAGRGDGPQQPDLPGLPGWTRLQRSYFVPRDGQSALVDIWDLTDDEIEAKACEHDAQSVGHTEHASQLRQFARERRMKMTAGAEGLTPIVTAMTDAALERRAQDLDESGQSHQDHADDMRRYTGPDGDDDD